MIMSLTNNIGIVELSKTGKPLNTPIIHNRNSSFDLNEAIGNIGDIDDNNKPTFGVTDIIHKGSSEVSEDVPSNIGNNLDLHTISEGTEDKSEIIDSVVPDSISIKAEADAMTASEIKDNKIIQKSVSPKIQLKIDTSSFKKLQRIHVRGHSQSVTQFSYKKINDILHAHNNVSSTSPFPSHTKFNDKSVSERTTPEIYCPNDSCSVSGTPRNIKDLRFEFAKTKNSIWKSDNNLLSKRKLLMSDINNCKKQDDEQKAMFAKDIKCTDLNGQTGSFQKLTVDKLTVDNLIVNELEVNKINGISKDELAGVILKLDQFENILNTIPKQNIVDNPSLRKDISTEAMDTTDEIKITEKQDDASIQNKKTSLAISGNTCCVIM